MFFFLCYIFVTTVGVFPLALRELDSMNKDLESADSLLYDAAQWLRENVPDSWSYTRIAREAHMETATLRVKYCIEKLAEYEKEEKAAFVYLILRTVVSGALCYLAYILIY